MHNTAFEALHLNFVYLSFDLSPHYLADGLRGLVALGIAGVNVTIPHKETVIPLLDEIASDARAVGAVNTIVNDGDKLRGYNTDVDGFVETLKPYQAKIENNDVAIIGAGGAARAVVYGLINNFRPTSIHIINRSVERAQALSQSFAQSFGFKSIDAMDLYMPSSLEALSTSKLIINATPIGMTPKINESSIETGDAFTKGQLLLDLVYNPIETKLMRLAKARGVKTISGLEMLIHQGAKSFELWTNSKMPIEKVREVLVKHIMKD